MLLRLAKDWYFFIKALSRYFFGTPVIAEKWVHSNSENYQKTEEPNIPKKIWMYWDSADRNELIKLCIHSIEEKCSDYEIIVLDSSSVEMYIDLPYFDSNLPLAVKADYIRLALLKKYGGIWMDASIFLTENFNWFLDKLTSKDVFVFYSDHCTTDICNPIVENWFIAAPQNSEFINDWFTEFEKCISSESPTTYYKEYIERRDIIQNIPNTDYLMCYISAAIIRYKKNYDICMVNSGSYGHYYNYIMFSNSYFIAKKLLDTDANEIYIPKLIKFTSQTRCSIEKKICKENINELSLMGRIYFKLSGGINE